MIGGGNSWKGIADKIIREILAMEIGGKEERGTRGSTKNASSVKGLNISEPKLTISTRDIKYYKLSKVTSFP